MNCVNHIRILSLFIFILPFVAINTCLIMVTFFPDLFTIQVLKANWHHPNGNIVKHITGGALNPFFPYIDGKASISRVARIYPSWLVFKPAMFLTAFLVIKYWLNTKQLINHFEDNHRYIKKFIFFGITSAVCLIIHSIFLGIKFEYDLYKLLRRVILLSFIIFEVTAQTYLVMALYELKDKIKNHLNKNILKLKLLLVSLLIVVALISIPMLIISGNKLSELKHILEWNYFLGVICFYMLTFFMWKKN